MPTAQHPNPTSPTTKPVFEARIGSIRGTVWLNESNGSRRHQVTFSRSYKTDAGWKRTSSFGASDLPVLSKVSDMAFAWVLGNSVQTNGGEMAA